MTLLKISERIRDHLTKQKARSINGALCQYRTTVEDVPLMCAVGCLIDDGAYNKNFEDRPAKSGDVRAALSQSLKIELDEDSMEVMSIWQRYHDTFLSEGDGFHAHYGTWVSDGCDPDSPYSPSAVHEYLKTQYPNYDMSGEITKRYIKQVSNYVASHLLKQGKQATNQHGACQYRGDNCSMCAVGVLIDQAHYSTELEGVSLSAGGVRDAVASSIGINTDDIEYGTPLFKVLRAWQRYHDEGKSTFSRDEIEAVRIRIDLILDDKNEYPNLKD